MDLKPGKVRDLSFRDLLQLHKEQRATLSNSFLSTPGSQRHLVFTTPSSKEPYLWLSSLCGGEL